MSDRLGNAKWEEQQQVSTKYPFAEGKFWLGRAEDATAIGYRDDRHICLVSGTRGGKGTSIIVNNLCFWPGSAVVIDPKGENATVTAARRGRGSEHCDGLGQAVHVLDPFNAAKIDDSYRSSFNPLDALDPGSEESIDEAARLANAIVVVKDERADPFFDESARSMVRGLILHVLTAEEFERPERTLLTVRDLMMRGEWRIAQAMREAGETDINPHQLLWRAMEGNPAFNGVVSAIGTRFLSMLDSSPKTFESVLQSAAINTEFLDSPGMRRVLASSDFKLAELKTRVEGMTLYLSLPQRYMDTHYRWLRMMVALTTTEMEIVRGRPATGHPVLMVLDEFAGLKRMTAVENAVSQIAGFGVKLFFVLQSLEQLKYIYKDNWETFLSNAGLKIFFSVEDHFTREYVSKLIGETELVRQLHSSNEGRSENDSYAEGSSHSQATSRSTTTGTSESRTAGTSSSRTTGQSQSANESRSDSVNSSTSRNESRGTSEGTNWSQGQSRGTSHKETVSFFGLWREIDPDSVVFSNGQNSSFGGSSGTSQSVSEGTSNGSSTGYSRGTTSGTSTSETSGRSDSFTRGRSNSETEGTSDTAGTSQTTTRGRGRTSGQGMSESLHRRPLLQPDDLGRLFARIDDPAHPAYPGFALVLITGADPVAVHRRHYFEDAQFIDCFSPHPEHKFLAPAQLSVEGIAPLLNKLETATNGRPLTISQWFIRKGLFVNRGQRTARIEQVPPDNRTVYLRMPQAGKTSYMGAPIDELGASGTYRIPRGTLYKIKYYEADGERVDPFIELRAACRDLDARKQLPPPIPPKPRQQQQPPPKPQQQPVWLSSPWLPRVGAACVGLSAAVYTLQVVVFLTAYEFIVSKPIIEAVDNFPVYFFGVWGTMILGGVSLWRGLKQPKFKPALFIRVLRFCLGMEAGVFAYLVWRLGTGFSGASFFDNLVRSQELLQLAFLPIVGIALYWRWFTIQAVKLPRRR